jgi:hypothetical protein
MPVTNIHFEDGVFYCKEAGEISPDDAMRWAKYVEQFAEQSPNPIIALIDGAECTFITAKARTIFARASSTPNLHAVVIATSDFKVKQSIQLISMMAHEKHTHVFDTIEAAADFAYRRAVSLRDTAGV